VLAICFHALSGLAYSSTLKMEATCSFEASLDFQRTARRYIPEDVILFNNEAGLRKAENGWQFCVLLWITPVPVLLNFVLKHIFP
jgi:hypothetical protein